MDFEYAAVFSGNKVLTDGPGIAADGGGMCVASSGDVVFEDSAYFTANEAESGGQGGAIANFGYLVFKRASTFTSNTATGALGKLFHQQLDIGRICVRSAGLPFMDCLCHLT